MPEKTLFIHIGTDKTGSSAIQSFIQLNLKLLESRGLGFVRSGSAGKHHKPLHLQLMAGQDQLLAEIVHEVRASEYEKHVLTFEGLYHH